MQPHRHSHNQYPLWKSYLVWLSLLTDPEYVSYRVGRRLDRLRGRPPRKARQIDNVGGAPDVDNSGAALSGIDVDLVYLWVQGQDPAHRQKREYWLREYGLEPAVANPDVRYVEHDELKYSLRSAELFLPWVRRIFIVTDNQVPHWLDLSHPKIRVVDHTEFADARNLPTFNSRAIAAQLHNIPGLCEHFILCNDDTFLGQPCRPDDFFARRSDGEIVMKVMPSESDDDWITPMHWIRGDPLARLWMGGWNSVKVAMELRRPWHKVRRMHLHQARALTKSALRSVTQRFAGAYRTTCANKFRSADDMLFIPLTAYGCLATGDAVRGWLPNKLFQYESDLRSYCQETLPTLFCINGAPTPDPAPDVKTLACLFPRPSAFERSTPV